MALAPCADCGHQVSDSADACPNCGRPPARAATSRSETRAALFVVVLVVALVVVGGLYYWAVNAAA